MVGGAGFCARVAIHILFVIYHIPAPLTGSASLLRQLGTGWFCAGLRVLPSGLNARDLGRLPAAVLFAPPIGLHSLYF